MTMGARTIRRVAKSAFLLACAVAVAALPGAAQTTYTLRDLGTLKGGSARVHGLNAAGQAVGGSGDPHGSGTHAYFWDGAIHDLGTFAGGDYSNAFGVNDSGQVVGTSNTANTMHAFLWTKSSGLQDLGAAPGDNASQAYAINAAGQIAGVTGVHAALWSGGKIQDLGTLGGATSEAHGINRNGQVVGVSETSSGPRAFLWNGTAMQDLGTLPGDTSSRADAINDQGTVIGASEGGGSGTRAFVWTSSGGMQDLGTLAGGAGTGYAEAFGINNSGVVVGEAGSSLGTRAFIWTAAGGMQDLNTMLVGNRDLVLTGAFAINDKGQIVAFGITRPGLSPNQPVTMDSHFHSGPTRVFLLTPK